MRRCVAHMVWVPTPKVKVHSGQRSKSCLSNNSKSTEANLTKLHRKIEHIEKVCRAQWLVPTPKVKVTVMSEGKLSLKLCCS